MVTIKNRENICFVIVLVGKAFSNFPNCFATNKFVLPLPPYFPILQYPTAHRPPLSPILLTHMYLFPSLNSNTRSRNVFDDLRGMYPLLKGVSSRHHPHLVITLSLCTRRSNMVHYLVCYIYHHPPSH